MTQIIGIRREDKNEWERRVPLTPDQVATLVREQGLRILVQPSPRRAFADQDYQEAGAVLSETLEEAGIILGVKEIPLDRIQPNTTYLLFSHTIKGQAYNMPMLAEFMGKKCQLIDYERITDDEGRRLVFFGRHAGLAGMVESLCALGRRFEAEGLAADRNPFLELRQPFQYPDLETAKEHLRRVGARIREHGLPAEYCPVVCGILGYGNVARGVQEILECLPTVAITPQNLLESAATFDDRTRVYTVVFREADTVVPVGPAASFDLPHYYAHPDQYRADFARYLPHLTLLINAIYWDDRYPVLVTRSDLRDLFSRSLSAKLKVIGDITCDIEGSIAATVKPTLPDQPCYVYDPARHVAADGVGHPNGPVVMAVDNLPTEFPREASQAFGAALSPFLSQLAAIDTSQAIDQSGLPGPLRRASIVYQGDLTTDYLYLKEVLRQTVG